MASFSAPRANLAQPFSPDMPSDVDAVVIGAGVIGLAVTRALSLAGHSVIVLEREAGFGTGDDQDN